MAQIPENLEKELQRVIADVIEIEPEEVSPDARFVEDLGMDSIKAAELVVAIEQKYKIHIDDDAIPKITTLRKTLDEAKRVISGKE